MATVLQVYNDCLASTTVYSTALAGTEVASPLALRHVGEYWWHGEMDSGRYNHTMPPNSKLCNAGNENYDAEAYPAMSMHPGGVNVAFADGSVRFIKQSINVRTWWALGTIAGGEIISSDAY